MSVQMNLDFAKTTISKTALDILRNGLREEDQRSKVTFEECLLILSQGKKLAYGAANFLLLGIMRSLCIENCQPGDEFQPGENTEDPDLDPTMSQIMANASTQKNNETIQGSSEGASSSKTTESGPADRTEEKREKYAKLGKKEQPSKAGKKGDKICRFYLNGKCKYSGECRFEHPKICPKFRQDGDCEVKGCGGGCDFIHPNVCHSSLRDKTCTYRECKFFHLKGTKTVERGQRNGNSNTPNWRGEQGNSKPGPNLASKNRQPSLSQKTRKKGPNPKSNTKQNPNGKRETTTQTVTQEEKKQLGQTLEAIMKRLDAMESRNTYYPQQGFQTRPQLQPSMSPAVPQLSSQTQQQWASQPPWLQTQSQM
jgi:hypothetical protein